MLPYGVVSQSRRTAHNDQHRSDNWTGIDDMTGADTITVAATVNNTSAANGHVTALLNTEYSKAVASILNQRNATVNNNETRHSAKPAIMGQATIGNLRKIRTLNEEDLVAPCIDGNYRESSSNWQGTENNGRQTSPARQGNAGESLTRYKVPGQYIYKDLLLGSGIAPSKFDQIKDMKLYPDDVIIASFPKTGTTLLQEIVWLCGNKGDVVKANQLYNYERILFIEFTEEALLRQTPGPRHFKTHVPYRLLPESVQQYQHKIVYILRNPKDTLVSYYYFYRMCKPLGNYKGSWNDFFQLFVNNNGKLYYGNMFDHMLAYWRQRRNKNLLIVFYEDILNAPHDNVRRIARFLDKDLGDDAVEVIVAATHFNEMRDNPRTNWTSLTHEVDVTISPFMRRGVVGDWKTHFTREQNEIFDAMCAEKLNGSDLTFKYQ